MLQASRDMDGKLAQEKGLPASAVKANINLQRVSVHTPLVEESEYFFNGKPLEKGVTKHFDLAKNDAQLPKTELEQDALSRRLAAAAFLSLDINWAMMAEMNLMADSKPGLMEPEERMAAFNLAEHLGKTLAKHHLGRSLDARLHLRYSVCKQPQSHHKLLCGGRVIIKSLFDPKAIDNTNKTTNYRGLYFPDKPTRTSHSRNQARFSGYRSRSDKGRRFSHSKGQRPRFFREKKYSSKGGSPGKKGRGSAQYKNKSK